MLILSFYIFSIFLGCGLVFYRLVFPVFQKIGLVLLNDAELRGGGGLITVFCDVYTFFGVPYKINKHSHESMNVYSEPSIYPFNIHLTDRLFFRDLNYSTSHVENFSRMNYFYQKNFQTSSPDIWITLPYSFIESIFLFPGSIEFYGISLNKNTLFRSLSHITGDNQLPPGKRKHVLLKLALYWGMLFLIPFIPHYILYLFFISRNRGDIGMSHYEKRTTAPFLGLCENNIRGRKGNRYMHSVNEYIFHITSYSDIEISGNGYIRLHKNLLSDEHFPFVGDYRFGLSIQSSEHFRILGGSNLVFSMSPRSHFYHEIPFEFTLPREGGIDIQRQSCTQNTDILVSFDTPPFHVIPITNLSEKKDHLHFMSGKFKDTFHLKYTIHGDSSPLRMIFRGILTSKVVQISFQKPIQDYGMLEFTYKGKRIGFSHIDFHSNNTILIVHLLEDIPYYEIGERTNVLQLEISNITDISGCIHHEKVPRKIWFPWAEHSM